MDEGTENFEDFGNSSLNGSGWTLSADKFGRPQVQDGWRWAMGFATYCVVISLLLASSQTPEFCAWPFETMREALELLQRTQVVGRLGGDG
jgi:hypothetical protein